MEITSKRDFLGMIFFALSVVILGYMFLTPLNNYIMHVDEYFTISVLTLPIGDILNITSWDVHPPLYYFLGKIAINVADTFGLDYLHTLRVLSIIPYIIILAISATKIRKDFGLLTAGVFTFSMAVMTEFFAHFLIARMYSWAILFLIISFIAFIEIIKTNDKKAWIILTVFSALCAYTHYFAAISAGCIYLSLFVYLIKYERKDLKIWIVSAIGAVILYLPWIQILMRQMTQVKAAYWIRQLNPETFIKTLSYFAYTNDMKLSLVAIAIAIALIIIYKRDSKDVDEKERFLVLSGMTVYFLTVILPVIFSLKFRPILMPRYLLPATAVMWLSISILFAKIKNRKRFMISAALIAVLLVMGFTTSMTTNDIIYHSGVHQKEIMDNITEDPNSVLIVNNENLIMYFLSYANQTDTYFQNIPHIFGENLTQLHKYYDFKSFEKGEIDWVILNNTGKDIYIISWNKPVLYSDTEKIDTWTGATISKVKPDNRLTASKLINATQK